MLALLNVPIASCAAEANANVCLDSLDDAIDAPITIHNVDSDDSDDDRPSTGVVIEALVVPSAHWSVPSVDCMHMWRYWFHGDSTGTDAGVPYRLFRVPHDSPRFPTLDAVSYVMSAILAHARGFASLTELSALPQSSLDGMLLRALPLAYPLLVATDPIHLFFSSPPCVPPPPKPFQFPALTIRAMWTLWFRGTPPLSTLSRGIEPLCKLRARDVDEDESKLRWWRTKQLFAKLTDLALLHPSVSSKEMLVDGMDPTTFAIVCDQVVMTFATESGCTVDSGTLCTAAAAWVAHSPAFAMSQDASGSRTDSPEARSLPAGTRTIPALSTRAMWPLWHRGDALDSAYKSVMWKKDRALSVTRRVMAALTKIAIESRQVAHEGELEGMSPSMLLQVLDTIFPVLASRYDVDKQRLATPDKRCDYLVRLQYR
ncbi:hypothetical protein DYB32_003545 [Aphanomyces invadans]|uniref:Uncharacterized protein n=1 Tax=Aphanomyces invadans TaxID=157072 RepID=A0A418B094_9STRA|nr:hypothetical protein DYB32_003545 [Aphanomyces invadans]